MNPNGIDRRFDTVYHIIRLDNKIVNTQSSILRLLPSFLRVISVTILVQI